MAHKAQINFCLIVRNQFPVYFFNKKVLDIGSMDVNGNNRHLFKFCDYTGIDIGPGKNVDRVCAGHRYAANRDSFDVIISTEVAEHDIYWKETMINCIRMLKPSGMLLFTCATTGRPEHGTVATETKSSPYTTNYYCNLTEKMIREIPQFDAFFDNYDFSVDEINHDLRLVAFKRGAAIKYRCNIFLWLYTVITGFLFYIKISVKYFLKKHWRKIHNRI
jgi:SAM-dependent methyltransferase